MRKDTDNSRNLKVLANFDDGFKVGGRKEREELKFIQSNSTLGDWGDDRNGEIRIYSNWGPTYSSACQVF